jgi:hypothetical protein
MRHTSMSDMTMTASSRSNEGEDIDSSKAECTVLSAPLYLLNPNWVMALSWRLIPKNKVASERKDSVVMIPGATPRTPDFGRKCKRVNAVKTSSRGSDSPG